VKNKVHDVDMPKTIYIISDMEFDEASGHESYIPEGAGTNFEVIKAKYDKAGYVLPQIVFWNVSSRQNNVPVKQNEQGVILVSGASPSTFKMVMEKTTPVDFMLKVLNSERYKKIGEALR
jgi:hypothetical protein